MNLVHSVLNVFPTVILWLWALAKAYPEYSAPLAGALLTLAFKPRSSEAYAAIAARNPVWLFRRVAAMLQLLGAIFPDPQKTVTILVKFITGKQDFRKLTP